MTTISPIIDSSKIVEVLFENAEEIPNDVYLNIMNLMKKYHDECGTQVYIEICTYLNNNKNRINGDIFKKIKEHFPEQISFKKLKDLCDLIYSLRIICLFIFVMLTAVSVIVLAMINKR